MTAAEFRNAVVTTGNYPEPVWRQPGFEPYPQPKLTLVDLINWIPTDTNAPQYMLEVGETNAATETEEAATAPEGAMNFVPQQTYTHRVTTTIPATRQALDDVAVLENLVGNRLMVMIRERLQAQVVAGNGALGSPDMGANLCGILNTPNVLSVAKVTTGPPLQPQVDAIAAAIAAIRGGNLHVVRTLGLPWCTPVTPRSSPRPRTRPAVTSPARQAPEPVRPHHDHHLEREPGNAPGGLPGRPGRLRARRCRGHDL